MISILSQKKLAIPSKLQNSSAKVSWKKKKLSWVLGSVLGTDSLSSRASGNTEVTVTREGDFTLSAQEIMEEINIFQGNT